MTASSSIGTSAIEQTTTFRDGNAKGERQLSRRFADWLVVVRADRPLMDRLRPGSFQLPSREKRTSVQESPKTVKTHKPPFGGFDPHSQFGRPSIRTVHARQQAYPDA